MTGRSAFRTREDYRTACSIPTRWMDNDVYNHVNNVVYYSWFDTAVNAYLLEAGLLDPEHGTIIGLVVESQCRYGHAISFPEVVTALLRIAHLGTSSVRYEIGLFTGDNPDAAAEGHFVHVYVDRTSRRPVALPGHWRDAFARVAVPSLSP